MQQQEMHGRCKAGQHGEAVAAAVNAIARRVAMATYDRAMYVPFWSDFHHFDCFELDVRGHIQAQGAAFSYVCSNLADVVLM